MPITVAAPIPLPLTSPTHSWMIPSGRRTASYQSPPTSTAVPAGEVVAGELDAFGRRQPVGEQAALEPYGEFVLVGEEPGALERVRGLVGERPEQVPLARLEPSVGSCSSEIVPTGSPPGPRIGRLWIASSRRAAQDVGFSQRRLALDQHACSAPSCPSGAISSSVDVLWTSRRAWRSADSALTCDAVRGDRRRPRPRRP